MEEYQFCYYSTLLDQRKILPTKVQEALLMKHGKKSVRDDLRRKRNEFDRLAEIFKN